MARVVPRMPRVAPAPRSSRLVRLIRFRLKLERGSPGPKPCVLGHVFTLDLRSIDPRPVTQTHRAPHVPLCGWSQTQRSRGGWGALVVEVGPTPRVPSPGTWRGSEIWMFNDWARKHARGAHRGRRYRVSSERADRFRPSPGGRRSLLRGELPGISWGKGVSDGSP